MTRHTSPRSIEPGNRLAAIDIGSNSIRLVVAEYLAHNQFRVLDDEREPIRLAESLTVSGNLSAESIEATIRVLGRFQKIAAGLRVARMRIIGTCALREAENAQVLVDRARKELQLDIEVISAEQEAQFAFISVKNAFDLSDRNIALADIGGGSTELLFASGGHIEAIIPTQLGAVRTTELYGGRDELLGPDAERLVEEIDRILRRLIPKPPFVPQLLFGSGGTFTNMASMLIASSRSTASSQWGYRARQAEVRHLIDRLKVMTAKQRRNVPGLNADRSDIIVAGLVVIDRIMSHLKVNDVQVHRGGVRDGLLWSMVQQLQPARHGNERHLALRQFAESCGADWNHSAHVGRLARLIVEKTQAVFQLPETAGSLIESAARLQDVGYLINYEQHHKHSYQLILNSNLPGFRRDELELIANLARYHRGSRPKKKHENFRQLSDDDQSLVKKLVPLLRIAGGLDRSHSQHVEIADVNVDDQQMTLWITSPGDPEIDIWSARKRSDLLERVYGRELIVHASKPMQV